MQKIGILTYHFSINYGALLQAYALYSFIKNKDCEVEFIDYRSPQLRSSNLKYLYYKGQRLINPFLFLSGTRRLISTKNFINKRIKTSKKIYFTIKELTEGEHHYDIMICGSDEIWNINDVCTMYGSDLSYFLNFIDKQNVRKFSYAASFGFTTELKYEQKNKISELLKEFDAISVRDSNSLELVNSCNLNAKKVLDPTFLISYENILKISETRYKYVLLYGVFSKEQGKYIKSFANLHGLDIIAINTRYSSWTQDINVVEVGPEEWLGYFSEASYIFTSYYHGIIFSLIFRKPFTAIDVPGKSIKMRDLLRELNLEERIVQAEDISALSNISFAIKWDFSTMNQMIQNSKDYLCSILQSSESRSK